MSGFEFRVGDKVKVEGVVTRVFDRPERDIVNVEVRTGAILYLSTHYLDFVERPVPVPKVGDRLIPNRLPLMRKGTIRAIEDGMWWVKWDGSGFTTAGPTSLISTGDYTLESV